ncbi:MAG: ATP-binding protein [Synergistaceae bacterium]|nr:ATP-binding protein [Synergistaceae bacterium]
MKKNILSMKLLLFAWFIAFTAYCGLLLIQGMFAGGGVRAGFISLLAGALLLAVFLTRSVTQRESGAERALMAFSSLLSSTPNFMVITASDNKVRYISEPMIKFAGISRREFAVGRPLLDLFRDKKLKLMFADILDTECFVETVMEIDTGGGGRYFKVVADRLTDEAGGMFIDISDITPAVESRNAAEEAKARAEEANSAKSRFLANMSHDLRTPLNVIMGMNEMIGRAAGERSSSDANKDIAEWSDEIAHTAESLLSLVESVLDVSNAEQGRHELNPSEYAASSLVRDLAIIGRQEARSRGLEFLVSTAQVPSKMYGDFERIRRIAANLLANAANYTERGIVALEVSFDAEKSELCLVVSDTGIGIRKEDIGSVFEKFSRVDNTKPGSGLGLTIAVELARLMGGDITVSSVWGEGSVFKVILPQRVIDSPPALRRKTEREEGEEDHHASFIAPECRILAVDDSPPNLNVTRLLLARTQMEVDTAASGEECVEIIAAGGRYHAILMDYMMPGMNGVETLLRVKEKVAGFATPAIMLTADAITDARIFLEAGFVTSLTKPVSPAALENALLSVLPGELVRRSGVDARIREETRLEYINLLAPFGVDFSEAMKYAEDVGMFVEQARIFIEGYEESREEIETAVESEDWASARRRCHSLRGLAGYVGASPLRETTLKIHNAFRAQDAACARAFAPALLFEWKRARDGLEAFVGRYGAKGL